MSDGPRMSYSFALNLANQMVELLRPVCRRVEIAGSLRRKKETIGDIEIVLIPNYEADLFGEPVYGAFLVEDRLRGDGFELTKNGPFFKQAKLPTGQVNFDIFLTTPEKWGCVFTIRTGSADFTRRLVTKRREGGLCPSNLDFKDGRIYQGGAALSTPEEADVFRALGLAYIDPENRGR